MANDTTVTLIGNLTADPELRFTPAGAPVCNFRIASTPSRFDRQSNEWVDEPTIFMGCALWGPKAEPASGRLAKGMPVIAQGQLRARTFEHQGQQREVLELKVLEVGELVRPAPQGQGAPQGRAQQDPASQAGPAPIAAGPVPTNQPANPWDTPGAPRGY